MEEKRVFISEFLPLKELSWNEIIFEEVIDDHFWRVVISGFQLPEVLLRKMFSEAQVHIVVPVRFKEGQVEEFTFWHISEYRERRRGRENKRADLVWVCFIEDKAEKRAEVIVYGINSLEGLDEQENFKLLLDGFKNSKAILEYGRI